MAYTIRPILLTLILLVAASAVGFGDFDFQGKTSEQSNSEISIPSTDSTESPETVHLSGSNKVSAAGLNSSNITVTFFHMNGTSYSQNITTQDGLNAFNYTIAAQENLSIALNFSVDEQWGGYISSIFNTSTAEAWDSALHWSWGFYTINATTGTWDYSNDGASFVNLSAGDAIAWAPTLDGTWLNISLDSTIDELIEEIAAAVLAEAEKVAMDAFEAFCQNTTHQITIGADGTSFSPSELEANIGDTICFYWQNETMDHNVVQVDGPDSTTPKQMGFDSGETSANGSHLWIVLEPGSSYFICEPHSALGMKLTITVSMPLGQPDEYILSDGVPGFTGMLGTIALLGAAFANHRRRD